MKKPSLITTLAITWVFLILMMVISGNAAQAKDLHRFYSPVYKGHFYTPSENEKNSLLNSDEWTYEGVAYDVSNEGDYKPVFRFWSDNFRGHFYTISESEATHLTHNDDNWNYEGISFYVREEGKPVYRFWSDTYKHHFYTTSETEKNNIDDNWEYEGIAWYVAENVYRGEAVEEVVEEVIEPAAFIEEEEVIEEETIEEEPTVEETTEPTVEASGGHEAEVEEETIEEVIEEVACEKVPMFNYYEDKHDDDFMGEGELLQRSTGFSTDNVEWQYIGHHNGYTDSSLGQVMPTEDGHYSVKTSDNEYFTEYMGFAVDPDNRYEKWLEVSATFVLKDGCVTYPYKTDIPIKPAKLPF